MSNTRSQIVLWIVILMTNIILFSSKTCIAQVGIGTLNPHPSSCLDVQSVNKGVLIPRMTTQEMLTISDPYDGLLVFNLTLNSYCIFDSTSALQQWVLFNPWKAEASLNSDVILAATSKVGIGTTNPTAPLTVNGTVRTDTVRCSWLKTNSLGVTGNISAGSISSSDTVYANTFAGRGAVPPGTIVIMKRYYENGNLAPVPNGWTEIGSDAFTICEAFNLPCNDGYTAADVNQSKLIQFQYRVIFKQ